MKNSIILKNIFNLQILMKHLISNFINDMYFSEALLRLKIPAIWPYNHVLNIGLN